MIVINAETGEYGIDEIGIEPGLNLKQKIHLLDYIWYKEDASCLSMTEVKILFVCYVIYVVYII